MQDAAGMNVAVAGDEEVCGALRSALAKAGCKEVEASQADVVLTFEPTQSGQEELYFGDAGVLKQASKSAVVVELSPSTPSFAREVYQLASVFERSVLAAPLVVKDPVATDAFGTKENLMAVCGGEHAAYEAAAPVLRQLACQVLFVGSGSDAQAVKAAHSIDAAAGIVGAVEAMASLQTLAPEADPEDLVDVLVQSGVVSAAHESVVDAIVTRRLQGTYSASLLMADLAMAMAALEETDSIMPQADAAFHLLELLAVTGGGNLNPAALTLMFGGEDAGADYGLDWAGAAAYFGADDDADDGEGVWGDGSCRDRDHDHDHVHGHGCSCGQGHGEDDEGLGRDDAVFGFSVN